jgi:hypothetical protein
MRRSDRVARSGYSYRGTQINLKQCRMHRELCVRMMRVKRRTNRRKTHDNCGVLALRPSRKMLTHDNFAILIYHISSSLSPTICTVKKPSTLNLCWKTFYTYKSLSTRRDTTFGSKDDFKDSKQIIHTELIRRSSEIYDQHVIDKRRG